MNFDNNYKLRLINALKKNKSFFLREMLNDMANVSKSYTNAAYYFTSIKYIKSSKDDNEIVRFDLQKSLDECEYPKLQKSLIYHYASEQPLFGSVEYENLRKKCLTEIDDIEVAFWADENNQKLYDFISQKFNCFEDKMIGEGGVDKLKLKGHVLNSVGWIEYYKRMLLYFYPDFEFDMNYSNQTVRYLHRLSSGLFLGFEFNENFYKKELERYRLFFPDTRIILINNSFNN